MSAVPALHVITGPTAVGKTAQAIAWAQAHDAEVLSCDSVCVYRGMDVGTAKPTAAEQRLVKHHGIDLVAPSQRYSVQQYIQMAQTVIADVHARGKRVVITGGSGFYLAAFFGPVTDDLPVSDVVIEEVRRLQQEGPAAVLARLQSLEAAPLPAWLDTQNPIRVVKALERRMASGRSLDSLREDFLQRSSPFSNFTVTHELIERPDEELKQRIALRTSQMLQHGLIQEAEHLLSLNLDPELPSARAVGYRATMDWLLSGRQVALEGLAERINLDTWALVRKQRKWFKRLGLGQF
jgi:tRNA dimethylallyltransferase